MKSKVIQIKVALSKINLVKVTQLLLVLTVLAGQDRQLTKKLARHENAEIHFSKGGDFLKVLKIQDRVMVSLLALVSFSKSSANNSQRF